MHDPVTHLAGVVCCFIAAILQQHASGAEHCKARLLGEGRVVPSLQLHIIALGDLLLKEAVKVVQHSHPMVDVSLQAAKECTRLIVLQQSCGPATAATNPAHLVKRPLEIMEHSGQITERG